ncbi:DUF1631 family protein [Ketobacter sp.]|nr:MAG: DUF1631 family protein [Ketobacter sp.]
MEKRKFPRHGVSIDAVFNLGEGEGSICVIEDFSEQGIFVTFEDQRYLAVVKAKSAELESIATVTFKLAQRYVSIDGIVVHQKEIGLGLKFLQPNPKYIEALRDGAALERSAHENIHTEEESRNSSAAAKKSNLIHHTNGKMESFLEDRIPEFLSKVCEDLINQANSQKSDAAQHPYFDAVAGFKKYTKKLVSSMSGTILSDASDVANGRYKDKNTQNSDATQQTLALVGKEEFEDWLVVRVAISRAELQLREPLIELQMRFDAAFGSGGARVYNPYSPAAICHAFYNAVRPLRMTNKVEKQVFSVLQETLLSHLRGLYKAINKLFIDAHVLPDIDVTKYLTGQAFGNNTHKPAAAKSVEKSEQAADRAPGSTSSPPSPADTGVATEPAAVESSAGYISGTIAPMQSSYQQLQSGLQKAQSAYSVASNLWRVRNSKEAPVDSIRGDNPVDSVPESQVEDFNSALEAVRSQVLSGSIDLDAPGALKQYLTQASGANGASYVGEFDSADMIESLFNNIVQSERIEESLRSDLRKLELPLLEVMRTDPTLFTAEFHPTRQAVNYLALLSDKGSINVNSNKPILRECVEQLVQTGAGDEAGTQSVLEKLNVLVEKEKKFIERNLSRVTEACSGQEKIKSANIKVEKELGKRFGDRQSPEILLKLVSSGWRDLMRLSYIREGIESRAWEMTLIVLDQLLVRVMPGDYDDTKILFKAEELVKLISKGLSKVSVSDALQQTLVAELEQLLKDGVTEQTPCAVYSQEYDLEESPGERIVKLGLDENDKPLLRWIKRAGNLKEGQWLEFGANNENSSLNQLAWVSENSDRFVFVNHQGMKVLDLVIEDLANQLRLGDAHVLSDSNMPAVEKGLDALIQKIYDQLAYESSHDQLTGLVTRKEFERSIAQSVTKSKRFECTYVLIFIDILQFKVINNTCGYEVGDQFLKEIARRIEGAVTEEAMIGRIGGSEFGVVQPIDADQQGYLLASDIKESIENNRFISDNQNFVISTVVSMVSFDESNNQILELLRSVESAAEIGKKEGRKEIQVVRPGDERMEERDEVMSWVTRINQALDDEQLKIRCQMIYPIVKSEGALPHFEVLLTVIDQNGEHLPPNDFIRAAEEYSRMGAVDRWVIESVLKWMLAHEEILDQVGGFSINLSGHSLNDETFLDFIFEALVRYEVPRKKLIFEITETTAVANLEDAADFINEMKGIGCRFSLDDFGAGQSSYAYLKRLPVDFIKIDGAFVRNITEDDVDYALVKSITEMGHFLNKKIVAEFVSDDEILEVVKDIGVDYVQGFYLGKPVLIEDLGTSLRPAHEVA